MNKVQKSSIYWK